MIQSYSIVQSIFNHLHTFLFFESLMHHFSHSSLILKFAFNFIPGVLLPIFESYNDGANSKFIILMFSMPSVKLPTAIYWYTINNDKMRNCSILSNIYIPDIFQ